MYKSNKLCKQTSHFATLCENILSIKVKLDSYQIYLNLPLISIDIFVTYINSLLTGYLLKRHGITIIWISAPIHIENS